ncbi:MAG: HEAT repeat domain-containing protein [Fimbriimonadales bacterium]|nr:HEAT repeat domain-containing protein [Fimbriimonadales bacterium]
MPMLNEREYQRAVRPIRELQLLRGSRAFAPQEWRLLTQTARDGRADFRLRVRALTALWQTPESRQQQEAATLAAALLDDPQSTVRAYAAYAIAALRAEQYLPRVERLAASDPDPTVREVAKTALARFAS